LSFSASPDEGNAFVLSAGGGRKAELLVQSLPLHRGFAGWQVPVAAVGLSSFSVFLRVCVCY